jgi:hypothetical protein
MKIPDHKFAPNNIKCCGTLAKRYCAMQYAIHTKEILQHNQSNVRINSEIKTEQNNLMKPKVISEISAVLGFDCDNK